MYDANGGSGAPGPQTATSSESSHTFTISTKKPTRSGYTFKGWANSKSATTADYDAGDEIKLSKDTPTKILYAVWEIDVKASYQVVWYDTEGVVLKGPDTRNGTVGSKVEVTDADKSLFKNF